MTHDWTGQDANGTWYSLRSDQTVWSYGANGWSQVTSTTQVLATHPATIVCVDMGVALAMKGGHFFIDGNNTRVMAASPAGKLPIPANATVRKAPWSNTTSRPCARQSFP